MAKDMEELLWSYIDNTCNDEERKMIDEFLLNNIEWKKKYHELVQIRLLIDESIELEEPSMRFTRNVMEEIAQSHIAPATKTYINKKIINLIATFFIITMGGLLIYGFSQINWTSSGNNKSLFDLPELDVSKYFNKEFLNIFLMLNVILGLILFDRLFIKKESKHKHN